MSLPTVDEYVNDYPDYIDGWYDHFKSLYPQWATETNTVYKIWWKWAYLYVEMYWKKGKRFGIITQISDRNFNPVAVESRFTDGLTRCGEFCGGQPKEENILAYNTFDIEAFKEMLTPQRNKLLLLT